MTPLIVLLWLACGYLGWRKVMRDSGAPVGRHDLAMMPISCACGPIALAIAHMIALEDKRIPDTVTETIREREREMGARLLKLAREFIEHEQLTCPEGVYQHDWDQAQIDHFFEEMCEIVGYHKQEAD